MTITVNYNTFLDMFPYFVTKGATQSQVNSAYGGAGAYISLTAGAINLVSTLQTRGVYLATAHILYLSFNPDSTGIVNSAGQGTENASFQQRPVKNWLDYDLGTTIYGRQLLSILAGVQPPMIKQVTRLTPYYNSISNLTNI